MELVRFLSAHKIEYRLKESLKRLSFVGIGGTVAVVAYPKNRGEMLCLLSHLYSMAIPYKVVGNMTNILPSDGFWGVCLVSTKKMRAFSVENEIAVAECGMPLSVLCRAMERVGIYPPAELIGIPATVGGAVYQNAGAFGSDISSCFVYADVFDPRQDCIFRLYREDMKFSYRASALAERGILLCAGFAGEKNVMGASKRMEEYLIKRHKRQPAGRSLGSVFLRVGDTSAAYYIDRAGLKGYRIGGAVISPLHAGFILNESNASAKDYRALIALASKRVLETFGIRLKTEIEIIENKEENLWLHSI